MRAVDKIVSSRVNGQTGDSFVHQTFRFGVLVIQGVQQQTKVVRDGVMT